MIIVVAMLLNDIQRRSLPFAGWGTIYRTPTSKPVEIQRRTSDDRRRETRRSKEQQRIPALFSVLLWLGYDISYPNVEIRRNPTKSNVERATTDDQPDDEIR